MQNIIALISYNGKNYQGFQAYLPQDSITYYLQRAFSQIANENIKLVCAGRTDKGVHATYQVVNFHTLANRTTKSWVDGVNANLPLDIRVREVIITDDLKFSARFNAVKRYYRYIIFKGFSEMYSGIATNFDRKLDVESMNSVAQSLLGEQDFSSFRHKDCNSHTPYRFVELVKVFETGRFVVVDICANAFLHNMVRNIVGCLLMVGSSQRDEQWFRSVLEAKDRTKRGAGTAPSDGLYLVGVKYNHDELGFLHPNEYLGNILVGEKIDF